MTSKVNLAEKLSQMTEYWKPRIVGQLNGQELKLAKLRGTFVWHHHENEDELLLCLSGRLQIQFRDSSVEIGAGEFTLCPRGLSIAPQPTRNVTSWFSSRLVPETPAMPRTQSSPPSMSRSRVPRSYGSFLYAERRRVRRAGSTAPRDRSPCPAACMKA